VIHNLYCIRDVKAELFNRPFAAQSDVLASRAFYSAAMSPESELSKFPDDYSLWLIGTFNDETGVLSDVQPRVVVASARMPVSFQE